MHLFVNSFYLTNLSRAPRSGADPGFRNGGDKVGGRGARAKILLINIHYSLKPIDFIAQTSAESSTTRYASPFAYAICMQAKVFAVQGHSYCITGVATNNYSMNFNYLAARGGNWPPIPSPWIRH